MLNVLKTDVFGKKRDFEIDSQPGEKMKQTFREKIDDKGVLVLVEDDYFDQQEVIESFADSVDVNRIIERYMQGDESALDRAKAFYADVTKIPRNFAQVLDLNNRAMNAFMQLPIDLQEKYGYSYIEFLNNPEILDEYIAEKNHFGSVDTSEVKSGEVKSDDVKQEPVD